MKIPLLNTALRSVIRKKMMESFGGEVNIFIVCIRYLHTRDEESTSQQDPYRTSGYLRTWTVPVVRLSRMAQMTGDLLYDTSMRALIPVWKKVESPM